MSRSQISQRVLMDVVTVAKAGTSYSDSVRFSACTGSVILFIVSSAAVSEVTISQQCSANDVDWYDPIDTGGLALGVLCTDLTTTTGRYTSFAPTLCNYIRFKVVEGNHAATNVTLKLLFRLEV